MFRGFSARSFIKGLLGRSRQWAALVVCLPGLLLLPKSFHELTGLIILPAKTAKTPHGSTCNFHFIICVRVEGLEPYMLVSK